MGYLLTEGKEKFWVTEDAEGYEQHEPLDTCFAVCGECRGNGEIDHPAFSNGITGSEWADWHEDEREVYLRGGYNIPCPECKGKRVVLSVDWNSLSEEREKEIIQHLEEEARYQRMCDSERRNGA